jgi:hypothetical protein
MNESRRKFQPSAHLALHREHHLHFLEVLLHLGGVLGRELDHFDGRLALQGHLQHLSVRSRKEFRRLTARRVRHSPTAQLGVSVGLVLQHRISVLDIVLNLDGMATMRRLVDDCLNTPTNMQPVASASTLVPCNLVKRASMPALAKIS